MKAKDAQLKPLSRDFYDRDTVQVSRELLGKWLVLRAGKGSRIGRIVEVEAYLGPHDLAAHSARGKTDRNRVMFGPPGFAYIYMIYGMYHCLNVVTEREGHASAVLIRALEPIHGIEAATNGPGRLCRAMEIDRRLNGCDLLDNRIFITEPPEKTPIRIVARPRIGVEYAGRWAKRLLRFYVQGNPYVSKR